MKSTTKAAAMSSSSSTATTESGGMEFGPRKTIVILAIVVGCFAILWPKIFYPMLTASLYPPPPIETSGCCDVIFESDVTARDIMQELCQNIAKHHQDQLDPRVRHALENKRTGGAASAASLRLCRDEVLARCGIDLSTFLAEKERLKMSYRQVLEDIRGFNGSLCLKRQFGVASARLGTPHLIRYHILMPHSTIRQERQTPPHAGSLHPALRERGRAIPSSHVVPKIQERPDHMMPMPMKMRPPMGGAGHVVPPPKSNGSLGILMPLYTIGIVIFFVYTISKVLMRVFLPLYTIGNVLSFTYKALQVLRKAADNEITRPEYSTAAAEKEYENLVFNPELFAAAVSAVNEPQDRPPSPLEELTPSIDELKTHEATESNDPADGLSPSSKDEHDTTCTCDQEVSEIEEMKPSVKVVNMEVTASSEHGHKLSRPTTPTFILPSHNHHEEEPKPEPVSIYLEGALPAQCELLVTDSKTLELPDEETEETPVVLSSKMTLSLISLDQESEDNDALESQTNNAEISRIEKDNITAFNDEIAKEAKVNVCETRTRESNESQCEEDNYNGEHIKGENDEEEDEEEEEEEEEEGGEEEDIDTEHKYPKPYRKYQNTLLDNYRPESNDSRASDYIDDDDEDDASSDDDVIVERESLHKIIEREESRKLPPSKGISQDTDGSDGDDDQGDENDDDEEYDDDEDDDDEDEDEEVEYEGEEVVVISENNVVDHENESEEDEDEDEEVDYEDEEEDGEEDEEDDDNECDDDKNHEEDDDEGSDEEEDYSEEIDDDKSDVGEKNERTIERKEIEIIKKRN
ncbi:glutamic acid-rich protein-like isoform X4 [Trichogramma pretiosum]|uniref:glutamic acid-rich protein-like isoform X4 n=1 Tax=Trichogramma pretiosum TaxID=7493 RepID=UPI000C7190B2|nr:glutamic acid-rich protein-like isoform X4 [Trichogramma pretiosum]